LNHTNTLLLQDQESLRDNHDDYYDDIGDLFFFTPSSSSSSSSSTNESYPSSLLTRSTTTYHGKDLTSTRIKDRIKHQKDDNNKEDGEEEEEEEEIMVGCCDYHPYMKSLVKKTDYYFGQCFTRNTNSKCLLFSRNMSLSLEERKIEGHDIYL